MSLSAATRKQIKSLLKEGLLKKIAEYSSKGKDTAKPFQYALFTRKRYLVKSFIHGCETSMGSWHEAIARLIAEKNFKKAKKLEGASKLSGNITKAALSKIEEILNALERGTREPDIASEMAEIHEVAKTGDFVKREETVDLYVENKDGLEAYVELKGPKPNKNEVRAAKEDLLKIYGIRAYDGKKVKVFMGMCYNTYAPKEYERWTVRKFFQLGQDLIIGDSFWDYLGGKGTYQQLVGIHEEVGEEISAELEKKFNSLGTGG